MPLCSPSTPLPPHTERKLDAKSSSSQRDPFLSGKTACTIIFVAKMNHHSIRMYETITHVTPSCFVQVNKPFKPLFTMRRIKTNVRDTRQTNRLQCDV